MRQCIIGKNSRIVSQIDWGPDIDLYSHMKIQDISFADYDLVWLFSWCYNDLNENLDIIRIIPPKKLVFVSTQSVAARSIAVQPYKYINDKAKCEDFVIGRGGRIFRIASVDYKKIKDCGEIVAFTCQKKLKTFILNASSHNIKKITEFYDLIDGTSSTRFPKVTRSINTLRSFRLINFAHAVIFKVIGRQNYGYTRDSQRMLIDIAMVGHGAIGGFATQNLLKSKDGTFVSDEPDIVLKKNGFRHQIIGLSRFGLGSRWHGVSTHPSNGQLITKKVDFKVFRSGRHKPINLYMHRISRITFDGHKYQITANSKDGQKINYFSRRLILGAGWSENFRLLSSLLGQRINTKLTDDESAVVGQVLVEDAIVAGLVYRRGPFILNRYGLSIKKDEMFVEARLPVRSKTEYLDYYSSTHKIVWSLARHFNWRKLNSALFNKFGISFHRGKVLDLFLTTVADDTIDLTCDNGEIIECFRTRLIEKSGRSVEDALRDTFPSFELNDELVTLDGLHVTGGEIILANTLLRKLIAERKLLILGTPGPKKTDPFHTTKRLQKIARSQVIEFYE